MSITNTASRKRKRDSSPSGALTFNVLRSTSSAEPILVSYPSLEAPQQTPFKCYARKIPKKSRSGDEEGDSAQKNLIVVGETNNVEFVSNEEETKKVAGAGCRYLLAVHNRKTGSLSLLPSPKTPHILTRTVKALKSIPPAPAPSNPQYKEARTALGESFGTKKAKAAIRTQERNRIDVSAMEGVMGYVMDGIEKGAEGLMTQEEAKETADSNRLIPPFSATATDPADIYSLHDIIPETEWKALSISVFEEANGDGARIALLPHRHSNWVKDHLRALTLATGKGKKKKLKMLLYISTMLAFRQVAMYKNFDKEQVYQKLTGVPSMIVDGLLARFTETARDSVRHQMTSATKTSILTHMFSLCLKLDNFATNTTLLAHDLGMKLSEVNQLFKSLGCKMKKPSDKDRMRLGIADINNRAVLMAPVEFPKPRVKKRT